MRRKTAEISSKPTVPAQVKLNDIPLHAPLIFSIFRVSRLQAANRFARTSKIAHTLFTRYLREKLLSESKISIELIKAAESNGIKLSYSLLYRLSQDASHLFGYLCRLTKDQLWPLAAVCGDIDWLKRTLKKSIKVVRCGSNKDIVFYCCMGGQISMIKTFFEDVLNHAQMNKDGNTEYFFTAASAGYFDICDHIKVNFGKSLSEVEKTFEQREIHFACQYGALSRIEAQKKFDSDMSIFQYRDSFGQLPIHYAVKGGSIDVICHIASKDPRMLGESDEKTGDNLLHIAALNGRSELVESLIEYGCDPKAKNKDENTPLQLCAYSNWICFKTLLPHSEHHDPNHDKGDDTILFNAASRGTVEFLINYISKYGRDCLRYRDSKGRSVAHELVVSRNIRKIRILVEMYRINLNEVDHEGNTPLLSIAINTDQYCTIETNDPHIENMRHACWMFIIDYIRIFRNQLGENLFDQENRDGFSLRALIIKNKKEALFQEHYSTHKVEGVYPSEDPRSSNKFQNRSCVLQ